MITRYNDMKAVEDESLKKLWENISKTLKEAVDSI